MEGTSIYEKSLNEIKKIEKNLLRGGELKITFNNFDESTRGELHELIFNYCHKREKELNSVITTSGLSNY